MRARCLLLNPGQEGDIAFSGGSNDGSMTSMPEIQVSCDRSRSTDLRSKPPLSWRGTGCRVFLAMHPDFGIYGA
jgi:hypothetical protein